MGLYDRDYLRDEDDSSWTRGRSMVVNLIIANVAVYLLDQLSAATPGGGRWLSDLLSLRVGTLTVPWEWWRFLTCGFAHAPDDIMHILFNMIALYFFGRDVEAVYGPKEFLRVYLTSIVLGAVVWAGVEALQGANPQTRMLGASGAVSTVLALFACHFPNRTILLGMFLPVPAWAAVGLMFIGDILTATGATHSNVAAAVHITGFVFGFIYYRTGWNLGRVLPNWSRTVKLRRSKLKLHDPGREPQDTRSFEARVDAALEKVLRSGEASLTAEERKLLEEASRRYQARRR
ncbi:MAG: rhomboid family intramembrane serine protease [Pirellulales bacterium]|nr:rhomboid family intramembrane serine protease [Pirellulales bacterium]